MNSGSFQRIEVSGFSMLKLVCDAMQDHTMRKHNLTAVLAWTSASLLPSPQGRSPLRVPPKRVLHNGPGGAGYPLRSVPKIISQDPSAKLPHNVLVRQILTHKSKHAILIGLVATNLRTTPSCTSPQRPNTREKVPEELPRIRPAKNCTKVLSQTERGRHQRCIWDRR